MAKKNTTADQWLPRPDEIKAYLDQYVIGQEEAKRTLSVAVYNHYKQFTVNNSRSSVELDKSNVMLLGETGSGKTHLVKTIAKLLDVPCYIQDCTKITASGYVGSDVEDCIAGLLRECNYRMDQVERGIIMLDEGDKIAKKGESVSITRDVSGECVQQSLLKIVEGDVVGVPPQGGRKHPEQQLLYVNTKNILFILSGAFVGLDKIISKRMGNGRSKIGFDQEATQKEEVDNYYKYTSPQDLRKFGMIPEFIGRFPVITSVAPLKESDLVRILKEPKNSLVKQYQYMLKMDNVSLSFSDEALQEIAHQATELKTGARGLRNIVEKVMNDIMFDAPRLAQETTPDSKVKIIITRDMVKQKMDLCYGQAKTEDVA